MFNLTVKKEVVSSVLTIGVGALLLGRRGCRNGHQTGGFNANYSQIQKCSARVKHSDVEIETKFKGGGS